MVKVSIESHGELNADKLVKELLSIAGNKSIIVIETFGYGLPSYFDAPDLYDDLHKIPCFDSMGEALYGIDMWLNKTCIKELAESSGKSFNEVLGGIISSIKTLNPLIRKYLPSQDVVIVVAQLPLTIIPLPWKLNEISYAETT